MALFQPSFIFPDARSGLGMGVIDATQDLTVSWKINGQSALTKFEIFIYENNSASTQVLDTEQLTTGCPAYGTSSTGEIQFFSYTIPAATLSSRGITNGGEYKMIIKQWWSANDSVTQSSASAFATRAAPTLGIAAIGTGGVVGARYYTFTGNYSQAQGDTLNWFRWRIAYADDTDDPFFDTENISGTMDISCYFDGLFTGNNYAVRLTAQTENGVEADTGWVNFSVSYSVEASTGIIRALCGQKTDAVIVDWSGIAYYPGTASPSSGYSISAGYDMTLDAGAEISWGSDASVTMSFDAPWSVVWRGQINSASDAVIFDILSGSQHITLSYTAATASLTLAAGGTTLASQGILEINSPITVLLTPTTLYIQYEGRTPGLYPGTEVYPGTLLFPAARSKLKNIVHEFALTYTQGTITEASIGGWQICDFFEIIRGEASAVTAANVSNGTYTEGQSGSDYMLVTWRNGINAGNVTLGSDALVGYSLYRRRGTESRLVRVADTDANTYEIYDYGAASQQGPYTYYLFPVGATTYISTPITSTAVCPVWWNWTLMECAETSNANVYTVIAAYIFRNNVSTSAAANNNAPNILKNFTPYPKIQLAPQNYKSATLTGLIGAVSYTDGQPEYKDTILLRDAIYALSVTNNALFLKNRKGDIIRIRISGATTMQTGDNTVEQTQTAALPWVEVGSADGVSLYAVSDAGVTP